MSPRHRLILSTSLLALAVGVAVPVASSRHGRPAHQAAERVPPPASAAATFGTPDSSPSGYADLGPGAVPRATPPSRSPRPVAPAPAAGGTLHYIANVGEQANVVAALGYNLFDTGPGERTNTLPPGGRALVWLGDLGDEDCAPPRVPFAEFTATVDRLAGHPRVYGYYIADEPHPRACPTAVDEIRRRADYIRARAPWQRSFIVVQDGTNQCGGSYGCEFSALRPAASHVDLIGLDPYPCSVEKGCVLSKVDDTVRRAVAAGVPRSAIVPVFQAFGQSCGSGSNYYRLPAAAEARALLARWATAVPRPAFDYTYTWGRQGSSCPTLVDADGEGGYPDLQSEFAAHNRRGS